MKRRSDDDLRLVREVCEEAGHPGLVVDAARDMAGLGIGTQQGRDRSNRIIDWLIEVVAFQGISDAVARKYMREHGSVTTRAIEPALRGAVCSKLSSYWSFHDCGYQKGTGTCSEPRRTSACPLPRHDLRNGRLNQTAYALTLFARDIADGDIVSWIDRQLELASAQSGSTQTERWEALRRSLLDPMRNIYGVGEKVLSMALSDLLLGAGVGRPLWREAGSAMIAVDTLVHNWLHRTGVIDRWGVPHPYGTKCYSEGGCSAVIERLAIAVDAREFDPDFPRAFPRFVQKAIWSFCAASEVNRCNGTRINDAHGCTDFLCPAGMFCDRKALHAAN